MGYNRAKKKMKKLLMLLALVVGIAFTVNAQSRDPRKSSNPRETHKVVYSSDNANRTKSSQSSNAQTYRGEHRTESPRANQNNGSRTNSSSNNKEATRSQNASGRNR